MRYHASVPETFLSEAFVFQCNKLYRQQRALGTWHHSPLFLRSGRDLVESFRFAAILAGIRQFRTHGHVDCLRRTVLATRSALLASLF
mmetsp:Transcript_46335/g.110315  ORF Transcript_46335/g.110315 Transcript_46335/m.110315 type:complete len:88 (-) Transcript_46335:220-483(-)